MNDPNAFRAGQEPPIDRADLQLRRRKARDRSFVLTLLGVALLLPPAAGLFQLEGKLFGLPATLIYLFAVWAGLIAGAGLIARRLLESDEP